MFFFIIIPLALLFIVIIISAGFLMPTYNENQSGKTFDFINIDGVRIHYLFKNHSTDKETLVFLHSFGGNLEIWNNLIPYFSEYNILAYDLPGFGRSDKSLKNYSLRTQSEILDSILIKLNINQAVLIGSSMGASTAVWFASQFPNRIKKLILMAPSGYPGSMNHKFPGNYFYKPGILNKIAQLLTNNFLFRTLFPNSLAYQALSVTASYDNDYIEQLKKIKIPVLIFWSKKDNRTLYEYASVYLKLLTNANLVTVDDDAKHNINSYKPDLISSQIKSFIEKP